MWQVRLREISFFQFWLVLAIGAIRGETTGFLPGDSFFASRVSEYDLPQTSGNVLIFPKASVSLLGSFGLSVGFNELHLTCNGEGIVHALVQGMQQLRSAKPVYPREVIEMQNLDGSIQSRHLNSFSCLFYHKSFDSLKYPIGLRANANWTVFDSTLNAGGIYNCEWAEQSATVEDWRLSGKIPALPVLIDPRADFISPVRPNSLEFAKRTVQLAMSDLRIILVPATQFRLSFDIFIETHQFSKQCVEELSEIRLVEDITVRKEREDEFRAEALETSEDLMQYSWIEITETETRLVTIGNGLPNITTSSYLDSSSEIEPPSEKSER